MENTLDLEYLLGVARRRWAHFVLPALVLSAIVAVIAVVLPPVYVSTARILVESPQIPAEFVRSSFTEVADQRIRVIEQRIMTRSNLLDIARKFDLATGELAGHSSSQIVDFMRARIAIEPEQAEGRSSRGGVTIGFTVSFEHEDPNVAARIAGELVTLILAADARTRRTRIDDTTEFLEKEAQRLEQELKTMEAQVADFRSANRDAMPDRQPFLIMELGRLRERATQVDDEIRVSEGDHSFDGAGPEADPLLTQLQALNRELLDISAVYSESHPKRKTLVSRMNVLTEKIAERNQSGSGGPAGIGGTGDQDIAGREASAEPSGPDPVLAERRRELAAERQAVNEAIERISQNIARAPEVELGLDALSRRLESSKAKLAEIWSKHAEARIGERLDASQKGERFDLIEQPTVPTEPVRPNRFKILAIGLFFAFGTGGAAFVVPELLDRSLRSPLQLQSRLNIRPLIVVPYIVTAEERRRTIRWRILAFILLCVCGAATVAAFHYFYMPLDIFMEKVINRFST